MVTHSQVSNTQKDHKVKVSSGYIVNLCLKTNKQTKYNQSKPTTRKRKLHNMECFYLWMPYAKQSLPVTSQKTYFRRVYEEKSGRMKLRIQMNLFS